MSAISGHAYLSAFQRAQGPSFGYIGGAMAVRSGVARSNGAPPYPGTLRIVYNNDPHEKLQAMPYLASAFRYFSREGEARGMDVLRLNSGDNNMGTNPREWDLNVLLKNLLQYHAVTMGNHELDLGSFLYARGLRHANFPTLISNLEEIPPGSAMAEKIRKRRIRTHPLIIQGKHGAYGVLGVTTPDLKSVLSPKVALQKLEVEDWDDTVEIVQEQVRQLYAKGVDKVILLSHLGLEPEKKLAKSVSGIDIIVGGHSHDVLNGVQKGVNLVYSLSGEPVLIVQAGKNAQWMGVMDVMFDARGRLIPLQNNLYNPFQFARDPQAVAIKNAFIGPPKPLVYLTSSYDSTNNPFLPDPVAQFTADALRHLSGADIALIRSSEIRSNINPGWLTDQDLEELMPFSDPMVRIQATGEEILDALEASAEGIQKKDIHPGMLNASGLRVSMSRANGTVVSTDVFNRAANRWEPLDRRKRYAVALEEFGVLNKKEFETLAHPERIEWRSNLTCRDVLKWGLQQAGAPRKPVAFKTDNRLRII